MKINIKYKDQTFVMRDKYSNDLMFRIWEKIRTFYELRLLERVEEISKEGVFIDLGANLGNHSVFFMNFCQCTKLYAVEACQDTADVLKINIDQNNPNNVDYEIFVKAITGHSGSVTLSDVNTGNTGLTRVVDCDQGDTPSVTIDELFADVENISVIKMDIEGFEYESIQAAHNILTKHNPIIIAELHLGQGVGFADMDKYLSQYGYKSDKINYATSPTYIWIKE